MPPTGQEAADAEEEEIIDSQRDQEETEHLPFAGQPVGGGASPLTKRTKKQQRRRHLQRGILLLGAKKKEGEGWNQAAGLGSARLRLWMILKEGCLGSCPQQRHFLRITLSARVTLFPWSKACLGVKW
jgi:hypothetical protein